MFENPAAIVYGTIVAATLLDAESVAAESYLDTIGGVLLAMALYWLAHSYADFAGQRLKRGESIHLADLVDSLAHELDILAGAAIPLLAVVLADAAGGSLSTAVSVGIYAAAGTLLVIELAAGVRARLSAGALLMQTGFGGLLGGLVIGLKILLH